MTNRPELKEAANNLQNQGIAIGTPRTISMPSLAVFGLYASSGLQGTPRPRSAARSMRWAKPSARRTRKPRWG